MRNVLIIGLCLSLFGCAAQTSSVIEKPYVDPQYGMTRLQLIDLLGKPQSIAIYKKPNETQVEFYFYVRQYAASQEKVPVCLIDNKVVGWGKTFYADHVSEDDIRIK